MNVVIMQETTMKLFPKVIATTHSILHMYSNIMSDFVNNVKIMK